MATRIVNFSNGSYLEFDKGKFDDFCVFLCSKDGQRKAPLDKDYFSHLQKIALLHGTKKVWDNFVTLYDLTNNRLDQKAYELIDSCANDYGDDRELIKQCFYILYASMIAENNKENTKLGKRIKRLGLHTLLVEGKSIEYSVSFMRGMSWQKIDLLCQNRGF